ncbi:DUF4123 domain-containing protein [Variovorax sp. CAN15]|uniref:DUF4123 domain-containing protein n=1 Tax=Variovorax sp. CAN15 TaxID=3046727 RepID=UPI002648AF5F|nr:DUF4123 domain-containing protein [Variovorax sp. CAN15]
MRAYLVLENWHAGALTAAIGEHHPAMAEDRVTVPDPHFKHREEDAPCLLQLPQHWADSSTDPMLARLAASDLPGWLAQAWVQAEQRQMQQPLCGVLFSDSIAVAIASHWAVLGDQLSPADGSARLLRYQDPRVLQRAWPVLSDAQRRQWLGPVRRWWTLEQPWGPWALVDLVQQDVSATSREPEWFQAFANPAGDTEPLSSSALGRLSFDLPQWWAAHSSPAGHRVWARLAGNGVRVDRQPDGAAMSRLLAQGRSLSLGGDDLEDFVDLTWRAHPTQDTKREAFWQSPSEAALLARVMDTLRRQPDLRFGTAYADAVSSR